MNIEVNFDNLTKEEQEQLNALVEKASKPKSRVWKPEKADMYFAINGYVEITPYWSAEDDFDEARYSIGNCFKTREEAEFALERLKVIAEMKRYIAEHDDVELDWANRPQRKFHLLFDYKNNSVDYVEDRSCKYNAFCTSRSDILLGMIKEIGKDRIKKYYFGVE